MTMATRIVQYNGWTNSEVRRVRKRKGGREGYTYMMNVSPLRSSMPHRIGKNPSHKHISRRRLERYSRNRCPGVRFLESCLIGVSSPSGIFVVGILQSISLTRHRRYDCVCRIRGASAPSALHCTSCPCLASFSVGHVYYVRHMSVNARFDVQCCLVL